MLERTLQLVKQLLSDPSSYKDLSKRISENVIKKFTEDPNFTFLVSFPRTGSHWLRLMMELYFEQPSLVRVFYYKDSQDFLTYHTHDIDLDVYRKNVLYLYRDPIPTVYSQLKFYQEDVQDRERIQHWAELYGKHLAKWLLEETVSEKKTILRYENLQKNLVSEFAKVTEHLGSQLDVEKIQAVAAQVSKEEVKKKTYHDQRVINRSDAYETSREEFAQKYSDMITDLVFKQNQALQDYL